jgi:Kdo2-lipid IVA lauroyltransferase/acyltransferase
MKPVVELLSQGGVLFMRLLGRLPLAWVRALGWGLGWLLYGLAVSRRRVVWTNLRLCFPQWSPAQTRRVATRTFVHFAQAWLDRGWLWHGTAQSVKRRLQVHGAVEGLQGEGAVVIFAPHFVGLDAGWTALTQQFPRRFTTIYSHQSNPVVDDWVLAGRQRFGQSTLFDRHAGPKPVLSALRAGQALYLLPDMNYGLPESIFVPFYGVPAATVTSLSRLARLGKARVLPVVTRMTRTGYAVQVLPVWAEVPGDDLAADTLLMNQRLQTYVDAMPDQYFWVHKRFKDQPPGLPSLY